MAAPEANQHSKAVTKGSEEVSTLLTALGQMWQGVTSAVTDKYRTSTSWRRLASRGGASDST